MTVVGLTGKICSGKNLAAEYFSELGYVLIDVDSLGHEILDREVAAVAEIFGSDIKKRDGGVNREILSRRVFSNINLLKKLEDFLHPLMVESCKNSISGLAENSPGIVLNAAILSRMELDTLCDSVIFISAPFCVRFLRARKSRGMKLTVFMKRNKNQKDINVINLIGRYKIFKVLNMGTAQYLHKKLDSIVKILDIVY
jgi:dephospho-CoA kinase